MTMSLSDRIAALEAADLYALRDAWLHTFGNPPPKNLRPGMLMRAVAYRLQAESLGDVTMGAEHAVRVPRTRPDGSSQRGQRLKLVRSWKGELHTVEFVEGRFLHAGVSYRSLSAVARKITGTQWNGLVFFGVKGRDDLSRARRS